VEILNVCGLWLGRPWGHGPAEIMHACADLGVAPQQNGDPECVDLRYGRSCGVAQQSRNHTGLCSPEGHDPTEWI
jgi:hypothetical protein